MRELSFLSPAPVYLEIGSQFLRLSLPGGVREFPLERGADGKLTAASREKMKGELSKVNGRKNWQLKTRAICALNASGVLLRKVTLPTSAKEQLQPVLHLQLEREFPLPPEELAWGWQELSVTAAKREVLLAAVRKETVEDYASVLGAAGFQPEFTLGVLARQALCPQMSGGYSILELGPGQAELISFDNTGPLGLRVLPLANLTAEVILKNAPTRVIYVSGNAAGLPGLAEQLAARADCRRLEGAGNGDGSSALAGLKKLGAEKKPWLGLQIKAKVAPATWHLSLAEHRLWRRRAAVLLAIFLMFPFVEALLLQPLVSRSLATFKKQKTQFDSVVAPELEFFQYLKQNQPPYLDTLYLLGKTSPPGLHIDSVSLNQQGEMSLKLEVQNAQQMMDFRSKLIDTGFFAGITVEEQTPVPNQPKLNVRMSLRWQPAGRRPKIKPEPAQAAGDLASNPEGAVKPSVSGPAKM